MAGTGKSLRAVYGKPRRAPAEGPDSFQGTGRSVMGCSGGLISALRPSEYADMNFVKNMNAWQPPQENVRTVDA